MSEWHTWFSNGNDDVGNDDRPGHTIMIKGEGTVENNHRKMWTAETKGEPKCTTKF